MACGGRTDTDGGEGDWSFPGGMDVGGTGVGDGGEDLGIGGAGGTWAVPAQSGGSPWTHPTTIPGSGSVPSTSWPTYSSGGAPYYVVGGTTWIYGYGGALPFALGGYGNRPIVISRGGAHPYAQGGYGNRPIVVSRGGAHPYAQGGNTSWTTSNPYGAAPSWGGSRPRPSFGGYTSGGYTSWAGARPQWGGVAGAYFVTGGNTARGGATTIGGWPNIGGAPPTGGSPNAGGTVGTGAVSGVLGALLQACSGLALDACQRCQCQSCTPRILECATDPGCLRLVECTARNGCSNVNCFITGPCSGLVSTVGGLQSPAVSRAVSMALCTATSGCGC